MQRDAKPSSSTARDVLRQARRRQRLTQAQLADRAGVSQTVVARYESGQQPTVAALERLVAASGYQLEWTLRHGAGSSIAVGEVITDTNGVVSEASTPARFPGPIGRRLTTHLDEVLDTLASVGATDPQLHGDVADGTEGIGSWVLISATFPPQASHLSLMTTSGHLGLLLNADVRVLEHQDVTAYGYDGEGVALTQDSPSSQDSLSRPPLT